MPDLPLTIRRATPEDAPALAHIEVVTWRAAYHDILPAAYLASLSEDEAAGRWHQNLLKHGPTGPKRVLLALTAATPIGFVRLGPDPDPPNLGLVYLLYVLPTHWRQGAGAALMRAALTDLHTLGYTAAVLWVLHANHRARRFYERLGWRLDGHTATTTFSNQPFETLRYHFRIPTNSPSNMSPDHRPT